MSEEDRIVNEILEKNGKIKLARKVYELENIIKEVRKKLVNLNDKFKTISGIPFNVSEIVEMIEMLDKEVN